MEIVIAASRKATEGSEVPIPKSSSSRRMEVCKHMWRTVHTSRGVKLLKGPWCGVSTALHVYCCTQVRSNTIDIHCSRTYLWCWLRFQELPSVPFVKKQGTLLMAMLHWHCPHHTVQFHSEECGYRYMVNRFLSTSAKSHRCIASSNLGSLQKGFNQKFKARSGSYTDLTWL
ncbi:hypothetical protein CY35_11G024300 [Sphagnum magellanicum]|nr:hypothetical protein CY35_11G024300 [Sphagnum magellanicum]